MSETYRIRPHQLVESGIKRVKFDESKVVLQTSSEELGGWSNTAETFLSYVYDDKELSLMISDLRYHMPWTDTCVKNNIGSFRKDPKGLLITKSIKTKLRKKPNKDEYTDNSIADHRRRAAKLDRYDLQYAKDEFRQAIEAFNKWYVEEQTKEVVNRFSDIDAWKFDEEADIKEMSEEIQTLKARIKELQNKRFQRKCDLITTWIENDEEKISDDFKSLIANEVKNKKEQGYKDALAFF